jgi:hypothetical protein
MKRIVLLCLGLIVFTACAQAGIIYDVSLNTTPLIGHPAAPFWLGFELADGSGTGDGNNAALLSNFQFGTGGAIGSPFLSGSAIGDVSALVVLTDAAPTSVFVQSFAPGGTLSFQLFLSTNVDAGGVPDTFIMSILDNTFTPIPTVAGPPLNPFISIDIDSDNPTVQTFASDPTQFPAGGGDAIDIPAPSISVPEPAALGLLSPAMAACAFWLRGRKRRK